MVDESIPRTEGFLRNWYYCSGDSCHIGEINYYVKADKKYFYGSKSKKFFCDYDVKNPSKEVLLQMIKETTFTPTEFEKDV